MDTIICVMFTMVSEEFVIVRNLIAHLELTVQVNYNRITLSASTGSVADTEIVCSSWLGSAIKISLTFYKQQNVHSSFGSLNSKQCVYVCCSLHAFKGIYTWSSNPRESMTSTSSSTKVLM